LSKSIRAAYLAASTEGSWDGIVLIDDESAPLADKVQAALRGITDKPLRFIINTRARVARGQDIESMKQQKVLEPWEEVLRRIRQ
jgi:hypothetical protein